jgi:hypothetical protein
VRSLAACARPPFSALAYLSALAHLPRASTKQKLLLLSKQKRKTMADLIDFFLYKNIKKKSVLAESSG